MQMITSDELDGMARPGLPKLGVCVAGHGNKEDHQAAEMTLKVLRMSNGRRNTEINEVDLALKVGKAAKATAEEVRAVIWEPLLRQRRIEAGKSASGEAAAEAA